jgi:hypothetical protein
MKWLLILFLMHPDGGIEDVKALPTPMTAEECEANGKAAKEYYQKGGLIVKHLCVIGV